MGRKMAGPKEEKNAANAPNPGAAPPPPGHFLTPDLESDTARFLAELREAIRRRRENAHVGPASLG
jgi:hypothetical protein